MTAKPRPGEKASTLYPIFARSAARRQMSVHELASFIANKVCGAVLDEITSGPLAHVFEDIPGAAEKLKRELTPTIISVLLEEVAPSPCVYVIRSGPGGPVKIGFSKKAADRLYDLQSANPEQLYIVAVFDADRGYEAALHQRLKRYRIRGEWFLPEVLDELGIEEPEA